MTLDPWLLAAAAIGLAGIAVWWVWALNRDTNKRIDTLAATTRSNSGAIIQLQTSVTGLPTTTTAPMNDKVWSGRMVSIGSSAHVAPAEPAAVPAGWASLTSVTPGRPTRATTGDPDETLRLRPPALSDIEAVLAKAARPLTRMEMAAELERQPWELLGDLKRLMLDGRLAISPSHGAEAAYTLADPTARMARMSVLPGVAR